MRDVNRIKPILNRIGAVWTSVPDARLGQLLSSAAYEINKNNKNLEGAEKFDIYSIEDEVLIKALEEYIKKHFHIITYENKRN